MPERPPDASTDVKDAAQPETKWQAKAPAPLRANEFDPVHIALKTVVTNLEYIILLICLLIIRYPVFLIYHKLLVYLVTRI